MAENSKIEWTHHTFNPWMGCTKVSPACKHCYAERDMDHHYGKVSWGPTGTRVLTSDANWAKPLKWNREAESSGIRKRVFCASLADVFEDWQGPIADSKGKKLGVHGRCGANPVSTSIPSGNEACGKCGSWVNALTMNDVRQRLFALIDQTPNLDWLLLTKRPENIRTMYSSQHLDGGTTGRVREFMDEEEFKDVHPYFRRNVWLGTSVENQEYADQRIPELLRCRDLSPVLFLSCEPLLGPLDLVYPEAIYPNGPRRCCSGHDCGCFGLPIEPPAYLHGSFGGVDWVIAGGESGTEARPTDPEWFRTLRDQCQAARVPFLFKQWGEFNENSQRVGKSRAGRMLDGVLHDEFPKVTK